MSKKIFEHFDQAISICENESQKIKNNKEEKNTENGSSLINKKDIEKNEIELNELKYYFFSYTKQNLAKALDEILDL